MLRIHFPGSCCYGGVINEGCDPAWYASGGHCYLYNTQKLVTRQQAYDECDVYSGTLLRVESQDEDVKELSRT